MLEIVKNKVQFRDEYLDLCCGNGIMSGSIKCKKKVVVDIYQPYLDAYPGDGCEKVCMDVVDYVKSLPDKCFDIVSCYDGVEHLIDDRAKELLSHLPRITRKEIYIFTPDGYSHNHREGGVWGIPGGVEYQEHKSGLTQQYYESIGYTLLWYMNGSDSDGKPIKQNLYVRNMR